MKLLVPMVLTLGAITGVMSLATPLKKETESVDQSLSDLFNGLKTVPTGHLHVAADGIVRSYDGEGSVIDFARADSAQLQKIIGWYSEKDQDYLRQLFADVDSTLVDDEQIWNPPQHLRSQVLPESESVTGQSKRFNVLKPEWNVICSQYSCRTVNDCIWHGNECYHCIVTHTGPGACHTQF